MENHQFRILLSANNNDITNKCLVSCLTKNVYIKAPSKWLVRGLYKVILKFIHQRLNNLCCIIVALFINSNIINLIFVYFNRNMLPLFKLKCKICAKIQILFIR